MKLETLKFAPVYVLCVLKVFFIAGMRSKHLGFYDIMISIWQKGESPFFNGQLP